MKAAPFDYHRPESADEAVQLLAELGEEAKVLAGGQSLVPMLAAVALDAELDALSPRGRRTIPASAFFKGMFSTALEPDELLVGIRFPVWTGRCGFAVQEFARRHGDFAVAGAVVGVELDGEDRMRRCAIGLIGLGSTPKRTAAAEAELIGRGIGDVTAEEIGAQAMVGLDDLPADMHGSSSYRRRVGAAMVARAWAYASAEASRG